MAELVKPNLGEGVPVSSVVAGVPLLGHVDGNRVMIVRDGNDFFAVAATCSHYGGPLARGLVVGRTVRCPWHHACFDLATGEAVGAPALDSVATYEVENDGKVLRVRPRAKPLAKRARSVDKDLKSVVIVGAGAAGTACALQLRAVGYQGELTLVSGENALPTDRPNLSKDFLAGVVPETFTHLRTHESLTDDKIEFVPGMTVPAINVAAKSVSLGDGSTLTYDALLVATGSEPLRLKIPGAELPHVRVLRTLDDCHAIIERAQSSLRAVVLGSSFIALEVAASLRQRGLDVDIVSPDTQPLARVLGDELGRFIRRVHEKHGVRFHLKKRPVSISDAQVTLSDGKSIKADLVVMGVGVRPRTELFERAHIKLDRGVVVDELFRTSAPDIYAAGDIARFSFRDETARIEHWVTAERQGQAAARAMVGIGSPFNDVPFFWSNHYDDVHVRYSGHANRWDRVEVDGSLDSNDASISYWQGNKVLALATLGRDQQSLAFEAALQAQDKNALKRLLSNQQDSSSLQT